MYIDFQERAHVLNWAETQTEQALSVISQRFALRHLQDFAAAKNDGRHWGREQFIQYFTTAFQAETCSIGAQVKNDVIYINDLVKLHNLFRNEQNSHLIFSASSIALLCRYLILFSKL